MRLIPFFLWLMTLAGLAVSTQARAEEPTFALLGRSIARAESLGYDEYRNLEAKQQLRLRDEARRWLREVDESDPNPQSFDACATAVGLCPYLAKAWLLYAQLHHDVGRYAMSDYCLQQVQRTLRFEAREDERLDVEQRLYALEARVAYNLGEVERCLASVERALDLDSERADLQLLRARCLGQLERHAEARAILRGFDLEDPLYSRALSILGNVELGAERLDAAADAFARAAKYGERGPIFLNDRGRLELARDQLDEAADYFREAIELLPSFMEARSNLAVALQRQGDLPAAVTALRGILERQPNYSPAHFNLAEVLRQQWADSEGEEAQLMGREALHQYGEALRYGYEPALTVQRRAELALQLDDLEAAEQGLLEIAKDPDIDPSVLYLLARVKKEQGDLRIAGQLLDMAFAAGFDTGEAYGDAGEIHLRSGRLNEAIDSFAAALERKPDLIITRVNLSIALAMRGDFAAADEALRDAESREPDHPAVRAQRQALRDAADAQQ